MNKKKGKYQCMNQYMKIPIYNNVQYPGLVVCNVTQATGYATENTAGVFIFIITNNDKIIYHLYYQQIWLHDIFMVD